MIDSLFPRVVLLGGSGNLGETSLLGAAMSLRVYSWKELWNPVFSFCSYLMMEAFPHKCTSATV